MWKVGAGCRIRDKFQPPQSVFPYKESTFLNRTKIQRAVKSLSQKLEGNKESSSFYVFQTKESILCHWTNAENPIWLITPDVLEKNKRARWFLTTQWLSTATNCLTSVLNPPLSAFLARRQKIKICLVEDTVQANLVLRGKFVTIETVKKMNKHFVLLIRAQHFVSLRDSHSSKAIGWNLMNINQRLSSELRVCTWRVVNQQLECSSVTTQEGLYC